MFLTKNRFFFLLILTNIKFPGLYLHFKSMKNNISCRDSYRPPHFKVTRLLSGSYVDYMLPSSPKRNQF